ncbi:MAG: hypothetical protein CVT66_10815 [Actinobacteria bacterium HGW-Actinobacteria-6]|nr:MAG: hypothetical protein CVT66_10815 [Actinobacteria bacterium HGW-Actinobacteria-6]
MKKSFAITIITALLWTMLTPSFALAYVPGVPSTAVGTSAAGKWATLRTTAYFSWPTMSTVKVYRVNVVSTSTHYGLHYVDWSRIQVRTGTSTVYDATCGGNHYITNMGSATCLYYPNKTLPSLASNRVGTSLRYVGESVFPVVADWYWTQNFGG